MKKSFLFSYVLAGMMLASCSSSDDVATGTHGFAEDGTGYVKVSLNLPTRSASSTRGVNDDTADGEAEEYKVNDATLIIFAGDNEADATFQSAYDLTGTVKEDVDNDQITSQYTVTQKVNSVSSTAGSHIYAFVVLNHGKAMTLTKNVLYVNGTALTGKTFSDFSKMQVTSASSTTTTSPMINFEKDKIMMTNAVVTTSPGNAELTAPTTLADVSTKIYSTEAEAKAAPAADIFVERMLAKVTLKCDNGTSSSTVTPFGSPASKFGYSLVGWELGNFNSNSYVSRQWDNSWNTLYSDGDGLTTHSELDKNKYRFAGINLIKEEAGNPSGDFYRTYFGKDANYDVDANFTDHPSTITDLISPLTTDGVSYCYENTVNVPMMDAGNGKKNATTALIKMKLTPSGWSTEDFYTKDNIKGTIYTEDQAKKLVSNRFFTDFTDKDQLGELFTPTITEGGDYSVNVTFSGDAGSQQYAVELVFTPTSGTAKTKVLTNSDKYTTSAGTASILQTLQNNITITKFKDCYSYYKVLVKHFGDELTPWNKTTKTTATGMYPSSSEANYLGRYGVVRNNWYEITVSDVSSIGAATAGELHVNDDSSSDDETTSYISCRINVLSWAKRTQSTVLGE